MVSPRTSNGSIGSMRARGIKKQHEREWKISKAKQVANSAETAARERVRIASKKRKDPTWDFSMIP